MRILRHAQIEVTMDVYTEVSDEQTLQALKRVGGQLDAEETAVLCCCTR